LRSGGGTLDRQQWAIGPWADSGMSKVEPRYKRALAALKAIARAIGNTAFRVEDYPGSKLAWGKRSFLGQARASPETQTAIADNRGGL
jgi:hypothetical protein